MQDVLPPNNQNDLRSIRNIPVPPGRRHFTEVPENYAPSTRGGMRGRSFWLWAAAVVVVCIIAGMLVSTFFAGATVTVYPRQASVTLPPTLLMRQDAPVGTLSYKLLTQGQSAQRTVAISGQQQVSESAQGTITIYNTYSNAPQNLIAKTRFETPDGKIYRIHAAVTVPGETKNASGVLTSSSLQAIVYADAPGDSYNIGSTRFSIPGFKGDPRYGAFYATTDGISGGFVGQQPTVSVADTQNAEGQMKQELSSRLPSTIAARLPDGYILVPGTLSITYDTLRSADAGGSKALLTENATGTEAIIRTGDLASATAQLQVQGYTGEAVDFADPSALSISTASSTPYSSASSSFTLSLSGSAVLLWQFDPGALEQALAGKNKSDFETIVKTFAPAIARATASIRPFWETSFPTTPSQIQVKVAVGN